MKNKSHELVYLAQLLVDFPANPDIKPELATILIQARYAAMLRNAFDLGQLLKTSEGNEVWTASSLPAILHDFLYADILGNAGQYRSLSEPNGGEVRFGREQEFSGTYPSQIELEIRDIFSSLQLTSANPVWEAAKLYQRFVQIHPFYDANGRIGRAIVTAYLDLHGMYMNWEAMEKNDKWLKHLNHCHRRYTKPIYDTYLTYHVDHWRKFIVPKSQIYSEPEQDTP